MREKIRELLLDEIVDNLNNIIISLDQVDGLKKIFCYFHNLKSLVQAAEFSGVAELCQEAESILRERDIANYARLQEIVWQIYGEIDLDNISKEESSVKIFFQELKVISQNIARKLFKKVDVVLICPRNLSVSKVNLSLVKVLLLHLVRNALEHGLEYPSERLINKKKLPCKLIIGVTERNNKLIFFVKDDGRGIPKKLSLEKLCSEGFSTLKVPGEFSGCGLGLYICQNIIQSKGGKIFIDTQINKGTKFTFVLPKQREN